MWKCLTAAQWRIKGRGHLTNRNAADPSKAISTGLLIESSRSVSPPPSTRRESRLVPARKRRSK
jgi:hypothetical protein